jgi:hypothetical protein
MIQLLLQFLLILIYPKCNIVLISDSINDPTLANLKKRIKKEESSLKKAQLCLQKQRLDLGFSTNGTKREKRLAVMNEDSLDVEELDQINNDERSVLSNSHALADPVKVEKNVLVDIEYDLNSLLKRLKTDGRPRERASQDITYQEVPSNSVVTNHRASYVPDSPTRDITNHRVSYSDLPIRDSPIGMNHRTSYFANESGAKDRPLYTPVGMNHRTSYASDSIDFNTSARVGEFGYRSAEKRRTSVWATNQKRSEALFEEHQDWLDRFTFENR